MQNVKKKILPQYFEAVANGTKTFELRKDEDDIQPGDILDLQEWTGDRYTGRNVRCLVTYVLRGCPEYGLMEGYCIIGIEAVGEVVATEGDNEVVDASDGDHSILMADRLADAFMKGIG